MSDLERQMKEVASKAIYDNSVREWKIKSAEESTRYCFLPLDVNIGMRCVTIRDVDDAQRYVEDIPTIIDSVQGIITRIDSENGFTVKTDDGTEVQSKCIYLISDHTNFAFKYNMFDHQFMQDLIDYWNDSCIQQYDRPYKIQDAYDSMIEGTNRGSTESFSCYYHIFGEYMLDGRVIIG